MEQHTELMQISEVTPEFLREFAQSTNSFYQSVEQILEGVSECRIRYGIDTDNNTITFGTLDSEKYENGSELSVDGGGNLIFGELRVLVGGDLGKSLFNELEYALDTEFGISFERIARGEIQQDVELTANPQEKATALVNGELKELPAVIDSQGKDITLDFLKETVNTVAKYHNQRQNEDKDPVWQFTEYEDLPSTSLISRLPPFEVEDEIRFNADSNQIEMSQAAFDWFEQYAPKHNDVSALEGQLLKHMRALDALETYELADTEGYRWSSAANLDETAEFKKERLQDFAKKHSIELSSDKEQSKAAETEKPRKLSLSERIDKARAENPRVDAPKQVQQRSNSSQEL